jgi:hypothetical protein
MPVDTRKQQEGRGSPSPRRRLQSTTGPRTGLSIHIHKQLLQDIEESGEGVASFKLKTLFHRKPDTYRLYTSSDAKRQIRNKLNKWKALASADYFQLLASLGVHPNGTRSLIEESEEEGKSEEEEEQEEPSTPRPSACLNNLPPRSPSPIMSTPNRNRSTPNRNGTPSSGRSISDLMSQMSSKCRQCSSSFVCAQLMDASNRPFLLCFKANDEDANEELLLNFEEPENNNGMLVHQCDVVIGKEMVECVTILKPIYDIRDVRNKRITATLLQDGSGIRVSEPTVPFYLLDCPHGSCERSKIAHAVVVKKIKSKNTTRQFKTVILQFPQVMTCNNKCFNKKGSNFLLNNIDFKALELKGKDQRVTLVESKVAYLTWKVATDGTSRDFNDSDDDDSDDDEWTAALSKHTTDQATGGTDMEDDGGN